MLRKCELLTIIYAIIPILTIHRKGKYYHCHKIGNYIFAFALQIYHLTLVHSNFYGEYLGNGDRYGKHCYCRQVRMRIRVFVLHIYT